MSQARHTVKLPEGIFNDAVAAGKENHRSPPMQIEHWAKLGKRYEINNAWLARVAQACKDNPDLSYSLVEELLEDLEHPANPTECISIEEFIKECQLEEEIGLES